MNLKSLYYADCTNLHANCRAQAFNLNILCDGGRGEASCADDCNHKIKNKEIKPSAAKAKCADVDFNWIKSVGGSGEHRQMQFKEAN